MDTVQALGAGWTSIHVEGFCAMPEKPEADRLMQGLTTQAPDSPHAFT